MFEFLVCESSDEKVGVVGEVNGGLKEGGDNVVGQIEKNGKDEDVARKTRAKELKKGKKKRGGVFKSL
jgi:hypothetical protein